MKKINIYLLLAIFIAFGCEEKILGPIDSDPTAPGVISNITVTKMAGGAKIEYDIPQDNDLLYVKAVYTISNGQTLEAKSSLYEKSLTVHGYNDQDTTKVYDVKLYAVDRSNNESNPVTVQITPGLSPLLKVQNNMSITRAFGGARFAWQNAAEAPLTFYIMADTIMTEGAEPGELTEIRILKNELEAGEFIARGYPAVPRKFGVLIVDNFGNKSSIVTPAEGETLTPFPEIKLDKSKMSVFADGPDHPVDDKWNYWEGLPGAIIDGNYAHTSVAISYQSPYPRHITVDLGDTYKLSRYAWFQRVQLSSGSWMYTYGNPKTWYVYARKEAPVLEEEITEDNDGDGLQDWTNYWTLIGSHEIIKPSGLPVGQVSQEDKDAAFAGHNFDFPLELDEMRYIRYGITSNFDGSGWCNFSEIDFYGTDEF
ncbi:DUF4959 domain-containing protein [Maribellus luteus]|nr:DUF4959 domain-containing protein [Maribellus luteus]